MARLVPHGSKQCDVHRIKFPRHETSPAPVRSCCDIDSVLWANADRFGLGSILVNDEIESYSDETGADSQYHLESNLAKNAFHSFVERNTKRTQKRIKKPCQNDKTNTRMLRPKIFDLEQIQKVSR